MLKYWYLIPRSPCLDVSDMFVFFAAQRGLTRYAACGINIAADQHGPKFIQFFFPVMDYRTIYVTELSYNMKVGQPANTILVIQSK